MLLSFLSNTSFKIKYQTSVSPNFSIQGNKLWLLLIQDKHQLLPIFKGKSVQRHCIREQTLNFNSFHHAILITFLARWPKTQYKGHNSYRFMTIISKLLPFIKFAIPCISVEIEAALINISRVSVRQVKYGCKTGSKEY